MKLGISTYTFTWAIGVPGYIPEHPMSVHALVFKAQELGIHVIQIADNLPLHLLSSSEFAWLVEQTTRDEIFIEVGTRGISQAHLTNYIDIAVQLDSPILRVVVDTAAHKPGPDEIVGTIQNIIPVLEENSIMLAIENHDRLSCETLVDILQRIDSDQVGICLDTVNSFGALQGPAVVVQALGPWVVNLHIKDFAVTRVGSQMGFTVEGKPAGQGRLNIPWLLESLRSFGRDFNAILELWAPAEVSLSETIQKEDEWAQESIIYLRSLIPE